MYVFDVRFNVEMFPCTSLVQIAASLSNGPSDAHQTDSQQQEPTMYYVKKYVRSSSLHGCQGCRGCIGGPLPQPSPQPTLLLLTSLQIHSKESARSLEAQTRCAPRFSGGDVMLRPGLDEKERC